jgi:hypothetical protein
VSLKSRLVDWLRLYVVILVATLVVILLGTFIYTSWTHASFSETLRWIFLVSALILISMGGVSLIPLSEYTYIRQGARNPAVIRAGMEDLRRGEERAPKVGVILVLVGITLILSCLLIFKW